MEFDEVRLGPFSKLSICDTIVPLWKLLFELLGRAPEEELEVIVDGMIAPLEKLNVHEKRNISGNRGCNIGCLVVEKTRC